MLPATGMINMRDLSAWAVPADMKLLFSVVGPTGILYKNPGYDSNDFAAPDIDRSIDNNYSTSILQLPDGSPIHGTYTVYAKAKGLTATVYTRTLAFECNYTRPLSNLYMNASIADSILLVDDNTTYLFNNAAPTFSSFQWTIIPPSADTHGAYTFSSKRAQIGPNIYSGGYVALMSTTVRWSIPTVAGNEITLEDTLVGEKSLPVKNYLASKILADVFTRLDTRSNSNLSRMATQDIQNIKTEATFLLTHLNLIIGAGYDPTNVISKLNTLLAPLGLSDLVSDESGMIYPVRSGSGSGAAAEKAAIFFTEGEPSGIIGQPGDMAIDTLSADVYQRTNVWTYKMSIQGLQGNDGAKGDQGEAGPIGPIGPAGPKGDKGDLGLKGDKGDAGVDAIFATMDKYSIAVPAEYDGTAKDYSLAQSKMSLRKGAELLDISALTPTIKTYYCDVTSSPADKGIAFAVSNVVNKTAAFEVTVTYAGKDYTTKCDIAVLLKGTPGIKGDKGDTGDIGPAGAKGDTGLKGDTGAIGPAGPKGDQGAIGPIGPQGVKGDTGPAGDKFRTLSLQSKTIPEVHPTEITFSDVDLALSYIPGQQVIVSYDVGNYFIGRIKYYSPEFSNMIVVSESNVGTGTYANWKVNLLGAQGPKGDKGDTGVAGPAGPQGDQGLQGIQGIPGAKGDTGLKGDTGAVGPAGPQGLQGIQGLKGDKGDAGAIGPVGPAGPAGPQGLQGIQGIQGVKGDTGDVGPVGPAGPQGIQGVQGLKGDKGDRGFTGPTGPQGLQGIQGVKGDKGDPGTLTTMSGNGIPTGNVTPGAAGVVYFDTRYSPPKIYISYGATNTSWTAMNNTATPMT